MSFDGNFKPRRQINLGGRRPDTDKNRILRRAALERKQRAEDRRLSELSIKLQAHVRRWLFQQRFHRECREIWFQKYRPEQLVQVKEPRELHDMGNVEYWGNCIRQFCMFASLPEDEEGLLAVIHLYSSLYSTLNLPKVTMQQLLSLTLSDLSTTDLRSVLPNSQAASFLSEALKVVHVCSHYMKEQDAQKYFTLILSLPQHHPDLLKHSSKNLIQTLVSPLQDNAGDVAKFIAIASVFVQTVLTSSLFTTILRSSKDASFTVATSLSVLIPLPTFAFVKSFSTELLLPLLANTSYLLEQAPSNLNLWTLLSLELETACHLRAASANQHPEENDESDSDEEETMTTTQVSSIRNVLKNGFAHGNLSEQASRLCSRAFLTDVFESSIVADSLAFQLICRAYTSLLQLIPNEKRASALMYLSLLSNVSGKGVTFLEYCWNTLHNYAIYSLLQQRLDLQGYFGKDLDEWFIMILMEQVYTRVLFTMIDEEFHSEEFNPLFKVLPDLCILLKNTILGLYSDPLLLEDINKSTHVNFEVLRVSTTQLLQQLYRGNERRRFVDPSMFMATGYFNLSEFETGVLQEAEKLNATLDSTEAPTTSFYSKWYPKTNILNNCPFLLPFHFRIHLLHRLVESDKRKYGFDSIWRRMSHVIIRRNRIFDDGYDAFHTFGPLFKGPIKITFVDEHGVVEEGIDGGGLTKEFLTSICRTVFDTNYGLFSETFANLLYPSTKAYAQDPERLHYYEFLGMLIGKCIYEGIQIDAAFAPFFIAKWLGHPSHIDDLAALDLKLYEGLAFLKHYKGDVENDLSLSFTVVHEEFGVKEEIDLIPNGKNISVTEANRLQYIHLVSNYYLNARLSKQSKAFTQGFTQLINPHWLAMFHENELQLLVGGAPVSIDVDDLRKHTVYAGEFDENSPTILFFWQVLREFSEDDKRALLKFVTSVARPPILGFKELNPLFCIRSNGNDETRLPTASTCVNLLKLPVYGSKQILRDKLSIAIQANTGFGFS
ncbi:ubiquitin-protein ligase E3 [Schizosaccharomyces japonicus yFS275]|uniref:HECT-type E3 ubiquitin transferase n=1 Tax=Schizosaccharomyces japonicus (strain yFS275 / FY16936) TaxID=402676 RepID=B6K6U0_SCHJY|nr:ubiquitin-protein ligase E3 [Schizosaccharomyces japonicus yFS275]EEB09244.1 ubiquitin-protein ligase E3 [Schizosaccharomyces japonicus yFS275]